MRVGKRVIEKTTARLTKAQNNREKFRKILRKLKKLENIRENFAAKQNSAKNIKKREKLLEY